MSEIVINHLFFVRLQRVDRIVNGSKKDENILYRIVLLYRNKLEYIHQYY